MTTPMTRTETDTAYRDLRARLRERVRIEDVLAKFGIPTRGRGRAFCPFHTDRRRPSLTFHAIETHDEGHIQVWKCFTCLQHGDLFTLVQLLGGYGTRSDAMRALAAEHGIPWPAHASEGTLLRDKVLDLATDYYAHQLAEPARSHLASRGLPEALIAARRIGYAPSSPITGFTRYCEAQQVDRIAESLGLIQQATDKTPRRDYFWGRVIFPNLAHGHTVDLQGRALPDREPKYLTLRNSPNGTGSTGEIGGRLRLYNAEACAHTHVVLCEGIPDTLSVLTTKIAACGIYGTHGWTDEFRQLFRTPKRVYVALDRDAQEAAIGIAATFGIHGRVLVPPKELGEHGDLNDWFVRLAARDPARFEAMLRDAMAEAPTPWGLWISRLPDTATTDRYDQVRPILRSLAGLPRLVQDAHLELLHRQTGVPATSLAATLDEIEEELSPPPGDDT